MGILIPYGDIEHIRCGDLSNFFSTIFLISAITIYRLQLIIGKLIIMEEESYFFFFYKLETIPFDKHMICQTSLEINISY